MVLHLGGDAVVPVEDIIAIIDIESANMSETNREFIKISEEEGFIEYISDDPPKSFVLAETGKKSRIFMSPISSATLLKRSGLTEEFSLDREER